MVCTTSAYAKTNWYKLSTKQIAKQQQRIIKHDKDVIRFWNRHPKLYYKHHTFAKRDLHFHQAQLVWTTREYNETLAKLRPHVSGVNTAAWLCIHRGEGAWNDDGSPYYGGLQMDYTFQKQYGSEYLNRYGTANNWPPSIQMLVAQRAHDGYNGLSARGFYPWPNTARACGLIS